MRVQRNQTKLNSTFRSYIDVVSIVYDNKNRVVLDNDIQEEKDKNIFSEEEIQSFYTFINSGDVYENLVSSFAPSLFGMQKVKLGLLC
jgi:DNA replicative helicase MCM subunit Mcm2 (Cdc46/Mcm family)